MNKDEIHTILVAWFYSANGDPIKDAFDFPPAAFDNLEEAFVALCEEHFGKDFIDNWELEDELILDENAELCGERSESERAPGSAAG